MLPIIQIYKIWRVNWCLNCLQEDINSSWILKFPVFWDLEIAVKHMSSYLWLYCLITNTTKSFSFRERGNRLLIFSLTQPWCGKAQFHEQHRQRSLVPLSLLLISSVCFISGKVAVCYMTSMLHICHHRLCLCGIWAMPLPIFDWSQITWFLCD